MSVSDLITFLSILVAILIAVIPSNKYYLFKWRLSSTQIWLFSIFSVLLLLSLINDKVILQLFPCLDVFYFNLEYLPDGESWALIYSLYLIFLLIFKQYNAKFSPTKTKQICDYIKYLLANEKYIDVIQILEEQNIINQLLINSAPPKLALEIYDIVIKYDKFIMFIATRAPYLFIELTLKNGKDSNYCSVFINTLLLSEDLLIEIDKYLNADQLKKYNFESSFLINHLLLVDGMDYSKSGIYLSLICEPALQELKSSIVRDNLVSINYDVNNSKMLYGYKIFIAFILLDIKTEFLIKHDYRQSDWLQYYKIFIMELMEILSNDKMHGKIIFKILNEIIKSFLIHIKSIRKVMKHEAIITDLFNSFIDIIEDIGKNPKTLIKLKKEYLRDIIYELCVIEDSSEIYKDCFENYFKPLSIDLKDKTICFFIEDLFQNNVDYKINITYLHIFIDAVKKNTKSLREYSNFYIDNATKKHNELYSHSIYADKIKRGLLKCLEVPNYLFSPTSFHWNTSKLDMLEKAIEEENKDFQLNKFDKYWSFVELYMVKKNINSKDDLILEKVINFDKFQVPDSMWNIKKNYNLNGISEFYSFESIRSPNEGLSLESIKKNNPFLEDKLIEQIIKIKFNMENKFLFESVLEQNFFIFYIRINIVKNIEKVIQGVMKSMPNGWVLLKLGVRFIEGDIEIAIFDSQNIEEVYSFLREDVEIPEYILRRIIFRIEQVL